MIFRGVRELERYGSLKPLGKVTKLGRSLLKKLRKLQGYESPTRRAPLLKKVDKTIGGHEGCLRKFSIICEQIIGFEIQFCPYVQVRRSVLNVQNYENQSLRDGFSKIYLVFLATIERICVISPLIM